MAPVTELLPLTGFKLFEFVPQRVALNTIIDGYCDFINKEIHVPFGDKHIATQVHETVHAVVESLYGHTPAPEHEVVALTATHLSSTIHNAQLHDIKNVTLDSDMVKYYVELSLETWNYIYRRVTPSLSLGPDGPRMDLVTTILGWLITNDYIPTWSYYPLRERKDTFDIVLDYGKITITFS